MRRHPWCDSCQDLPDLMSKLSRLKLSARLCNLRLNPDAARPLARLMSRLSKPYVQTLQTQTFGATMQFGSKPGCGVTLGATPVQTFQTLCSDIPDETLGATMQFGSESGRGVTRGATMADMMQLSRPRRRKRDFSYQGGNGANFATKADTAWFSRQRRTWRNFSDQLRLRRSTHDSTDTIERSPIYVAN